MALGLVAGCQFPGNLTALGGLTGDPEPSRRPAPAASAPAAPGGGVATGNRIETSAAPALAGSVFRPQVDLVGNNAAGLINPGGAVFYRAVLALETLAVAGATVSLVGVAGDPLGAETTTAADGTFAFATAPATDEPYVARAEFDQGGQTIRFESLVTPSATGTATTQVDVASTLIARKVSLLAAEKRVMPRELPPQKLGSLVTTLRGRLAPGQVPLMAGGAPDVPAVFDQLALDDPELRGLAGAVTPELAKPAAPWLVETVVAAGDQVKLGLLPTDAPPPARLLGPAGTFAVDANGNVYLPTLPAKGAAVRILKIKPASGGEASTGSVYAELPAGYLNPVSLAFSPNGLLHALAVEVGSLAVRVFTGEGRMQLQPGTLYSVGAPPDPEKGHDPESVNLKLLGRVAVDASQSVFVAFPFAHFVTVLHAGQAQGTPLAGSQNVPGFLDGIGSAARFRTPFSVAIGPGGRAYVADKDNRRIRSIAPDGAVKAIAGDDGDDTEYRNGRFEYARFGNPESLAFGPDGSLFVTDVKTRRIRRLSKDGSVFLIAGTGLPATDDGPGHAASFYFPRFLTADGAGNLYVLDQEPTSKGGLPPRDFIRRIRRQ
ncbi:MAG: hypothetical protein FJZ01_02535 [Candidatus Sericytochromatia bacterium]|nr:hypothetical protein [Candidatus Tanganyikabacteria bacterium]